MLRKRDLAAVIMDLRLSPAAARVVLFVGLKGDGEHEIAQAEFRQILNGRTARFVREAIDLAEQAGWITERKGGRDHHNLYSFVQSESAHSNGAHNSAENAHSSTPFDSAENDHSNANDEFGLGRLEAPKNAHSSDDSALLGASKALAREQTEHRIEVVEEEERELSARASEILFDNDAIFKGARGAISDYLVSRVPDPSRQNGWLQSALMCLDGSRPVFHWPDGSVIPPEHRPRLLAAAVNDLLQTDEQMMKGRVGEFRNLLTKLEILIAQEWERINERNNGGSADRNGTGRAGVRRAGTREPGESDLAHLG